MSNRRRAVHARQRRNVISRADLAVLVPEALKRRRQPFERGRRPAILLGEGIVAGERAHCAIMLMHMRSDRNVLARKAYDLAEFADGIAFGDRPRRHFVTPWDPARRDHPFDRLACRDLIEADNHIVLRVKTDCAWRAVCHGCPWLVPARRDGTDRNSVLIAGREFMPFEYNRLRPAPTEC